MIDAGKQSAAAAAAAMVEDGMLLGLGSGSTAARFIAEVGRRVREEGLRVRCLATSDASARQATALELPLVEGFDDGVDLAVDGADEVDPRLRLIKGRGGALVREKLVAEAARRFVVVADSSKLVDRLGSGTLPVEVVPFQWRRTARRLGALGADWALRGGIEAPFVSDNGNLIVDLTFARGIEAPEELGRALKAMSGVVDHGLFLGLATLCLVGDGAAVRRLEAPAAAGPRPGAGPWVD